MDKKRVLQVNIENTGGNGAFSLVQYLFKYLKDDYIFDYFSMGNFTHDTIIDEIIRKGGKCYSANLRENKLIGHMKLPFVFYKYLKLNNYNTVHIHSEVAYKHFLYALGAKIAGVNQIIIHSHSSNIDGNNKGLKYFCHTILRTFVNELGTDFFACSELAAKWMFTKKTLNSAHFRLLHNGIDASSYKFSMLIRNEKRKDLGISKNIVLGHVGALKKVKNQDRLLDIIRDLNDSNYKLLLIGDGDDREKLEKKAKSLNIKNQILFLGSRTDVAELLQAIDVMVFPSFFEGIPMALIEAQATGVPIICSDTVNKAIKINNNIEFISLKETNSKWISFIKNIKDNHIYEDGYLNVLLSDYNIKNSADELKKVYMNAEIKS